MGLETLGRRHAAGNLYIADTYNNRVRRVSASTGLISTVAGTGVADFCGDGASAIEACLNSPQAVTLDGAGHLYIVDTGNYRIRRVDAGTEVITTVAGNGGWGTTGDGEEATWAEIGVVRDVAVDAAGDLYFTASEGNRVRRVSAVGAPTYWLTIAPAPSHGSVAGGGLSCGTVGANCQAGFGSTTTVTLTATADPDYLFTGWGGACAGTGRGSISTATPCG